MAAQSDLKLLASADTDHLTNMGDPSAKGISHSNPSLPLPSDSYVSNNAKDSKHVDEASVKKVVTLEQRYIELLERRIATLEEQLEIQGSEAPVRTAFFAKFISLLVALYALTMELALAFSP